MVHAEVRGSERKPTAVASMGIVMLLVALRAWSPRVHPGAPEARRNGWIDPIL